MNLLEGATKNWIHSCVKEAMKSKVTSEIYELMDIMEKLMEIEIRNDGNINNDFAFKVSYAVDLNNYVKSFFSDEVVDETRLIITEAMLKKVVAVAYPDLWKNRWVECEGTDRKPWTMAPLYKATKAFERNGMPKNSDLNDDPLKYMEKGNEQRYWGHYLIGYDSRIDSAHGYSTYDKARSMMVVILDTCEAYRDEIENAYAVYLFNKDFDADNYCKEIIKEGKEKRIEESYEEVFWDDFSGKLPLATQNIEAKIQESRIKLIGGPGVGKSTTLKYCQFMASKAYLDKKTTRIPVYIELKDTVKTKLEQLIANEIKVDTDKLDTVFANSMVSLYLDGYNEILEENALKATSTAIDEILDKYKKLPVVITDRFAVSSVPVGVNTTTPYHLVPLEQKQIINMFRRILKLVSNDDEIVTLAWKAFVKDVNASDNALEFNLDYKWLCDDDVPLTPLVIRFIVEHEVLNCTKKRNNPEASLETVNKENFWKVIIPEILKREASSKKEERLNILVDLLHHLATKIRPNETMDRETMLDVLKNYSGLNIITIDSYLELADSIRLFNVEEGCFFAEEIREYFYETQKINSSNDRENKSGKRVFL